MLRIIEEVDEAVFLVRPREVFFELTTIIGLYPRSYEWSNITKLLEEIFAIGRGIGFVGVSEGKSGADINSSESEDVALDASSEDRDGIHLHEVTKVPGRKALSLSAPSSLFLMKVRRRF